MNKVPITEYYIQAMDLVRSFIDGQTDQEKKNRHKEFIEEGFFGTRYRVREPFNTYSVSLSNDMTKSIEDSLVRLASESIMLLGECLNKKDKELKVLSFPTEEAAKQKLSMLKAAVVRNGFVTVAYYYSICGLENILNNPGNCYLVWTDLSSVQIVKMGDSYFIDLPKPIELQIGD